MTDLAVVGAGVVGLGAALAAAERGLSVVVLDRDQRAVGASVRNFGHAGVTGQSGPARDYGLRTRELWLRYLGEAGGWYRTAGAAIVARRPAELGLLEEFGSLRGPDEVRLLNADALRALVPVADPRVVGGAHLPLDLQVDPRQAVHALARVAVSRGVELCWGEAVTGVEPGVVHTTRGEVRAEAVVVAVGHDVDRLFPEVAAQVGLQRCVLDMLSLDVSGEPELGMPALTGSSLLRYSAFADLPGRAALRDQIAAEEPVVLDLDINEMYTRRPDGTLVVGDTHRRGVTMDPFQPEAAFEELVRRASVLWGIANPRVVQRWRGVYASAAEEYLVAAPADRVRVASVTTGIGMTTGLGFAQAVVGDLVGPA